MKNFDDELKRIFGDKYQGCTQRGDELVEYRLKPGEVASPGELAKVAALPQGIRADVEDLKSKVKDLEKKGTPP